MKLLEINIRSVGQSKARLQFVAAGTRYSPSAQFYIYRGMTGALSVLSSVSDIIGPEHQRLAIPKLHEEVQCITYRKSKATLWIYGIRIARPRYIAQTANALATKPPWFCSVPSWLVKPPSPGILSMKRQMFNISTSNAKAIYASSKTLAGSPLGPKRSTAPKMPPGLTIAADDIGAKRRILIHGGHDSYVAGNGVEVMPRAAAIEIVSIP
jgi:hypothetical protein